MNKLLRFFTIIILLFSFILINLQQVNANDFNFDYEISNTVNSDLKLVTEYNVTITNNIPKDFVGKSKIVYPFKPDSIKAVNDKESLTTSNIKDENGNYIVTVDLKATTGLGLKYGFKLTIQTSEAVVKKGNIIDISIPGLSFQDGVKVNKNILKIAKTLPPLKYMSKNNEDKDVTDKLNTTDPNFIHYSYSNSLPISLILADRSKYNFTLSISPNDNIVYFPRISEKQKFTIANINEAPTDTLLDNDNNLVLDYSTIEEPISVKGTLEIITDKYKAEDPKFSTSLKDTFWKYDKRLDPIIEAVNKETSTPMKVKVAFNELSKIIQYSEKNKTAARLETSAILDNPKELHSINISDLVLTVLKSANVESRLVGGFIDSQVSKEFVGSGLQFWIEYYDPEFTGWKEADPTLQLISPENNYYDSIGLSHIEIFKTNSGLKIPSIFSYKIQANSEDGAIQFDEIIESTLGTTHVQSGKDKNISIIIKNTGNTIANVKTLDTTIGNDKESTIINKIIFPNQSINIDAKIKNDNYYEHKTNVVNINVNTDSSNYLNQGNLMFSQSNDVLLIVGIIAFIIISILMGVIIFSRRNKRHMKSILNKTNWDK